MTKKLKSLLWRLPLFREIKLQNEILADVRDLIIRLDSNLNHNDSLRATSMQVNSMISQVDSMSKQINTINSQIDALCLQHSASYHQIQYLKQILTHSNDIRKIPEAIGITNIYSRQI